MTDGSQSQNTEADHMRLDNVLRGQEEEEEDEMWRKAQRRWRDGQHRSEHGTLSAVVTPDETGQEGGTGTSKIRACQVKCSCKSWWNNSTFLPYWTRVMWRPAQCLISACTSLTCSPFFSHRTFSLSEYQLSCLCLHEQIGCQGAYWGGRKKKSVAVSLAWLVTSHCCSVFGNRPIRGGTELDLAWG